MSVLAEDYFILMLVFWCGYAASSFVSENCQVVVVVSRLFPSTSKNITSIVVTLANCITACCTCSVLVAVNSTACDVVPLISFWMK